MAARAPLSAANGVLSYFTRHATLANLLLVVLITLGIMTYPRMRAQFFPDVVIESVNVTVSWDGAGAEDVDTGIVQVLEPALLAVDGVEEVFSRATEGRARIEMEFEPGWDVAQAADDVQVAVDEISTLPEDSDTPIVRRGAWRDSVTDVVITGPVGIDQLGRFTDEMVVRLFDRGVTRTTIRGIVAPEILIELPSVSLLRHDVTMAQVAAAIREEVSTAPAGDVASGAARVRTGVAKRSADQIEDIVLRSNPDGSKLTIGDVGRVLTRGVDRDRSYFVGDRPAVALNISRSAAGDAIALQEEVEEVRAAMLPSLPDGVEITLMRTRSELIKARINMLMENGLQGLSLVLILLFLFLNARTALWVAAGIPVAMLSAIFLMYMSGLTINMISLFALIITLGIVVDDAIVVGEHADFRARRLGETPVEASENAARRMFPPVFSATMTTVIAFFGLTSIGGRFGDMIADIPFTVIVVLLASLVECFLILPHHMAHALTHTAKEHWYDWPSRQVNRGFRWVRDQAFRPLMKLVIRARYPVMAAVILLLMNQAAIFIRGDLTFRFFNAPERSSITANFAMVSGATRDDTLEMMGLVQAAVDSTAARFETEYGRAPLTVALAQTGGNSGRGLSGVDSKDTDLLGAIVMELIDADLRPYSVSEFVSALQENVPQHPLLETLSFRGSRYGPGGDALDVELYGAESETLKAAAEALKKALADFPEVSALEDSMAYDKDELILDLTPQGQALGFTIDGLGRVLRARLNGLEAATFPDGTRTAAIRVELPEEELTADFLDSTQMRSAAGTYVPLADLVSVQTRTGFSSVERENGIRLINVTGDLDESDPARAEEITRTLADDILPRIAEEFSVTWQLGGLAEQQDEFLNDARTGLILSLLGIYLTLGWIFSSWTRPFVVMAIIPFGLIGAIIGHVSWGVPLSMFSVVGLIGMTGIIINDSIVLVTTIDAYARDRGLVPAIIDGAADRLRAVMLTTATTVLGLAPLLYETSRQAQFLKPTVITLTYGLGFGMVLVLIVVPALVAMQADLARMVAALRRLWRARSHRAVRKVLGVVATAIALLLGAAVTAATLYGLTPLAVGVFILAAAGITLVIYIAVFAFWHPSGS
ncbi:Multidrug efflux pump subunit AcrB [Aliiroseovarius sp. xm-m-379]|uniref:efflux RND transporter permease subunit n=1 Tax=unclassified Aliiroseovarius TaxID=2623558 RepID=UPI00156954BF|nr:MULTISPECIES: efflux RND transporter permease subunit [unclassified Aliiroseovarius]NRP13865.1 Multidrug efflux pump subunit AcrB [Aliiroseovarius sp. xm-d-517]NRP25490.1 Multidrug efflux pump subunit AcrB [Aliiroseovarius sp. xm-m-379]NRP29483.1 Multidrug efflux pump subunit AcrB [Aliiroseovarius sp. xm-m-314]NRP34289.1 Multidrug efflux pump subunit AcrB [Aliiroseovarius sp. xm-a-104]NRP41752.1 Multidrug efflux pump subunit AcrB [Aliiroseovarius sp. xm-m-339-2]